MWRSYPLGCSSSFIQTLSSWDSITKRGILKLINYLVFVCLSVGYFGFFGTVGLTNISGNSNWRNGKKEEKAILCLAWHRVLLCLPAISVKICNDTYHWEKLLREVFCHLRGKQAYGIHSPKPLYVVFSQLHQQHRTHIQLASLEALGKRNNNKAYLVWENYSLPHYLCHDSSDLLQIG